MAPWNGPNNHHTNTYGVWYSLLSPFLAHALWAPNFMSNFTRVLVCIKECWMHLQATSKHCGSGGLTSRLTGLFTLQLAQRAWMLQSGLPCCIQAYYRPYQFTNGCPLSVVVKDTFTGLYATLFGRDKGRCAAQPVVWSLAYWRFESSTCLARRRSQFATPPAMTS